MCPADILSAVTFECFSAAKLRWAHRLKVYVPLRLANRCLPTQADSSTSPGITGVAPDEFA